MTMSDRRRVLLGLAAQTVLLGACAAERQIADGKRTPAGGGIGGTGIVGTLTGLGSLRINGLRLVLAPGAEIRDAFGAVPERELRSGLSLTVEAAGPRDALRAVRVAITHPLVGPVTRLSRDGRRLTVLGTEVALLPGVNAPVETGDRVAVSGLWRGGEVVASRLDRLASDGPDGLSGAVKAGPGGLELGGLTLALPRGETAPAIGSFVTVTGKADGEVFRAATISRERFTGAAGPLERLSVEGYLEATDAAPGRRISGLGHNFDDAARLDAIGSARAVFVGAYTGRFEVAAALPLPERPDLIRARLSGSAPISERADALQTR